MGSRSVQTQKHPVQVKLEDGSFFVCSCRGSDFRITEEDAPLHLFCRCGQVYTIGDLPPLWEDS